MRVKIGIHGAVPIALLQKEDLTLGELRSYTALASFQGTENSCFPSLEKIAERSGQGVTVCCRAIAKLCRDGWVSKIRRGKGLTNLYHVLVEAESDLRNGANQELHKGETLDLRNGANLIKRTSEKNTGKEQKKLAPAVPVVRGDSYHLELQERLEKAEAANNAAGVLVYGLELMHGCPFANYPQEWANAKRLVAAVQTMGRGNGDMIPALRDLLRAYQHKRRVSREVFWKEAPLTPSGVLCRLEQLVGAAGKQRENQELDEISARAMRSNV